MNRKCGILAGILAAGVLLTACGGEFRETGKAGGVSEGAVSGSAVSGAAVDSSPVIEENIENKSVGSEKEQKHPFANKSNFYREVFASLSSLASGDEEGEPIGIVQYVKKDVRKRKRIEIKGFEHLLYVTEEGVYYTREDSSSDEAYGLWRMPIRKGTDGNDILDESGAEKILVEEEHISEGEAIYVDSRYIVYMTDEHAVKYDRKNKTKTRHKLVYNDMSRIDMVNKRELVIAVEHSFYHWDLEDHEWTLVWKGKRDSLRGTASLDNYFFYSCQTEAGKEELRMYDLESRENRTFLADADISQACEAVIREKQGKIIDTYVYRLFCQNGKMYVEVQVDWEKSSEVSNYRMNYLLFDVDLAGTPELQLNKVMMECIEKWSVEDSIDYGEEYSEYIWNAGRCYAMVDGKAIFVMNRKGKRNRNLIYCYDLSSGNCRQVTTSDEDFFLPYYNVSSYACDSFEEEMSYEDMNFLPDELDEWYYDC